MVITNRYMYIPICDFVQDLNGQLFLGFTAEAWAKPGGLEARHSFLAMGIEDDQAAILHQQLGRKARAALVKIPAPIPVGVTLREESPCQLGKFEPGRRHTLALPHFEMAEECAGWSLA
jgi:hypothetical protein